MFFHNTTRNIPVILVVLVGGQEEDVCFVCACVGRLEEELVSHIEVRFRCFADLLPLAW